MKKVFNAVRAIFDSYIPALVVDGVSASLNLKGALTVPNLKSKIQTLAKIWKNDSSDPEASYVIVELRGDDEVRQRFIVSSVNFDSNHLVLSCNPEEDKVVRFSPDVHPKDGEYWSPNHRYSSNELENRGYIKGFVRSEIANLRLTVMVQRATGKENNASRMIQDNMFIFRAGEFDLPKLVDLSEAKNWIITQEILEECRRNR